MRQQLGRLSLSQEDLLPASKLLAVKEQIAVSLEQPQESGTTLLLPLPCHLEMPSGPYPQECLVTRGTWGRLCPAALEESLLRGCPGDGSSRGKPAHSLWNGR